MFALDLIHCLFCLILLITSFGAIEFNNSGCFCLSHRLDIEFLTFFFRYLMLMRFFIGLKGNKYKSVAMRIVGSLAEMLV